MNTLGEFLFIDVVFIILFSKTLGRHAISLLENKTATEHPAMDGEATEELVTFDSSFYIYGGQQHYEDLEVLSNECAKSCNKSRANLDGATYNLPQL